MTDSRQPDARSASSRPLVVALGDLAAEDLALAGGKAANLATALRAGLPVPDGFLVTTRAYALAAAEAGLDPADAAEARERSGALQVPDGVAAAVREAYRVLGGGPVAVRSSATAEDLPEASFAGQQDTFLDVAGEEPVLDAVRRCWASLWGDRAIAYRAAHAVATGGLAIAVLVQRMVDARAAGVLFTADPVSGRRGRTVIEAVAGLGDAVVSGAVRPDRAVVDPATGTLREHHGTAIAAAEAGALAGLGGSVERLFGSPQDIEWAIDREGRVLLLQARPITTLYPLPSDQPDPAVDLRVYFSANVAQGVIGPLTPMGLEVFRLIEASLRGALRGRGTEQARVAGLTVVAGLRLWIDLTPVLRNRGGRAVIVRALSVMEARSAAVFRRLSDDPRLAPGGGGPRRTIGTLRSIPRFARGVARLGVPGRVARVLRRPEAGRRRLLREVDGLVRADPGPLDTSERRLDAVERLALTVTPQLLPRLISIVIAGFGSFVAARLVLRGVASEDELRTVLRGLPHNPTTEMNLALWAVARHVADDAAARAALEAQGAEALATAYRRDELPPVLQDELAAFLARYGHRAVAEIDVGVPRWSEDPTHLLGAIANYLRLEDPALAPDVQFARAARQAEATIERLLGRLRGPRRRLARALFGRVRALVGAREAPKFHLVRLFARYRAILAPVGADLAAADRLEAADDIWFVTLAEARRGLSGDDLRDVVAARRAQYERERRRRHVPRVMLSDGTEPEAGAPALGEGIRGTPASPGVAVGPARVIRAPAGATLDPGEVLVAPSTDPGWTPLFLTAGALVMEMGGMMSHGAVVAREYGIPAVVGVPDATELISTGERVVVDGSAGTVAVEP